ncbi:MAG: hypothetical protein WCI30_04470 [Clostridia bacterium]
MEKKKIIGVVAIAISAVSAIGAAIYAGTKFLRKKKQDELVDDFDINNEDIVLNPDVADVDNEVEADLASVNEAEAVVEEQVEEDAEEVLAFEKATE